MKEYDIMLSDIVKKILDTDNENINLSIELRNILDINLYRLLLNINKKQFKYEMDREEEKAILEFIRLLNNFKVQVELNRRPIHLEERASKVLDCFYGKENILLNYLEDTVSIEDILLTADIQEVDNIVIKLSKKKKDKDKINKEKSEKMAIYTRRLCDGNFDVREDKIILDNEEISIDEFKELFNYLLNIDNYEFSYKNNRIKNLQLNIVNDIINILNSNELDLNKISKVIIPLLLNNISKKNNMDKEVNSSAFKIENISINDLLNNKNNEIKEDMAKVKFDGNDIALSNSYLFGKILKIFMSGKYYFNDDMFIIDDKDFKSSICINKMIDYLISMI